MNFGDLGALVNELHTKKMHNILIFDPALAADYDSMSRGVPVRRFSSAGNFTHKLSGKRLLAVACIDKGAAVELALQQHNEHAYYVGR